MPREVKVEGGDLEGILAAKMLYRFLGGGLVSVEAVLVSELDSGGILGPAAPVVVEGVVKAGAPLPAAPTTAPATVPAAVPLSMPIEVLGEVSLAAFPAALLVSRTDLTVVLEGLGGAMLVAILGLAIVPGGGAEP